MALSLEKIFEAVNCAQSLRAYLGSLAEEQNVIGFRIQALADSEFESGLRALQQASCSEAEALSLTREARSRFNKALSLEVGLRLAHAHFALAVCHSHLGDGENAGRSLREILDVEMPDPDTTENYLKGIGIGAGVGAVLMGPLGWLGTGAAVLGVAAYRAIKSNERDQVYAEQFLELEDLKDSVREYLNYPPAKPHVAKADLLGGPKKRAPSQTRCPKCNVTNKFTPTPGRTRIICVVCGHYFGIDS